MARARAKKPDTVRVLLRGEWVEEMPAEAVPAPGGTLEVAGRELTVWSVGEPRRAERPACDVRVRAAEGGLLAGWQQAALEAAVHGRRPAAPRNDVRPAEPPVLWGVRIHLVAHMPDGRRMDPVTRHERDLTIGKALDALADATKEAIRKWSGGTFGVTGRVVLTADGREQLRAEIAREKGGGPAAVDAVIDAMEAITVAAECLYEAAEPGVEAENPDVEGGESEGVAVAAERLYSAEDVTTDGGDGQDLDDLWASVPEETPKFHYRVEFEGYQDTLDTVDELRPDEVIEHVGLLCRIESIGPPDADGVRTAIIRREHPDQND